MFIVLDHGPNDTLQPFTKAERLTQLPCVDSVSKEIVLAYTRLMVRILV